MGKRWGPEHSSPRGDPVCSYTTVAEPKMSLMVVVIENTQLNSKTDADLPSGAFKVSNLGDDALSNGPALMVQKGTVVFGVRLVFVGEDLLHLLLALHCFRVRGDRHRSDELRGDRVRCEAEPAGRYAAAHGG